MKKFILIFCVTIVIIVSSKSFLLTIFIGLVSEVHVFAVRSFVFDRAAMYFCNVKCIVVLFRIVLTRVYGLGRV